MTKPEKLKRKDYEERLEPLQRELASMARWAAHTNQRILVVIEGRDTAGKGGVIDAITAHINPRQCRTVALPKPSERERSQWYFQRYVPHLPAAGEIVLFDRSWYNRAGVEKVMGFADDRQVKAFLKQAPVFEKMLVDDGILLFKYWLCCDQDEQEKRFAERREDPLKAGSCRRSTSRPARSTTSTRRRARPCSRPRTPTTRPGHSSISTTRSAAGSR